MICKYNQTMWKKYLQKQLQEVFHKINVLKKFDKNSQENVCVEETLTQVFFCGFCEIFKSAYIAEHLQTADCASSKITP